MADSNIRALERAASHDPRAAQRLVSLQRHAGLPMAGLVAHVVQKHRYGYGNHSCDVRLALPGIRVTGRTGEARSVRIVPGAGEKGGMSPRSRLRKSLEELEQEGAFVPFLILYREWLESTTDKRAPAWTAYMRSAEGKRRLRAIEADAAGYDSPQVCVECSERPAIHLDGKCTACRWALLRA